MQYRILPSRSKPPKTGKSTVYLVTDNWNDYSFHTLFYMYLHDGGGSLIDIGSVKIAFVGQTPETATHAFLPKMFNTSIDGIYSLGQSYEYYRRLASLEVDYRQSILETLGDVVAKPETIDSILDEPAFKKSLLRDRSLSVVKGQFTRGLEGKPELTDFKFRFRRLGLDTFGSIEIDFTIKASSTPSTNIHAMIGRNGVGKTTILNGMIEAVTGQEAKSCRFYDLTDIEHSEISNDYFSNLVSISFSAFDPFMPPKQQSDPSRGTCYSYIGLKRLDNSGTHRTLKDLYKDTANSLAICFNNPRKAKFLFKAIEKLSSDNTFASTVLAGLQQRYKRQQRPGSDVSDLAQQIDPEYSTFGHLIMERLSSGHALVLLTITSLIATVEEKTLVIIDEPECHLHPPLLSAFIRVLSDLLHDQNGVAIIATHSPVVLQEIPRSCVWKVYRSDRSISVERPSVETFGENVGMLTSEVFGLEVEKSGFHCLLSQSVALGSTFSEIIQKFDNQLGFEGRAILGALIANRDKSIRNDEA